MKKIKIAAFLPAKGTSERIQSKNTRLLFGKPLFLHTLEKLCKCDFIDEVYLDSESDYILDYAKGVLDYIPLKRDPKLANNKTDGHQMFYNEVIQADADIYIQILGTSPFIKPETIKRGVDFLIENEDYDSAVLVRKEKQYLWNGSQPSYDKNHVPNSIDLPDTITESMGLYIVRKETALTEKKRYGNNCYLLEAEPIETLDINFPAEFELAEYVTAGMKMKEMSRLRTLANFINSSVLSDIMFDYGVKAAITGLMSNLPEKKVFGRANTLKIRRLKDGEDYRGIYKGLDTYEKVIPGDFIIVDNEVQDFAYFGELNANLAVRSGAVATLVNGVTRDIREVTKLDYPVYSKGYCCADVKGNATVESHNCKLEIQGVEIYPGDLIFADINGIVVIPQRLEEKVLAKAVQVVTTEKNILGRILNFENAAEIYEKEGEF